MYAWEVTEEDVATVLDMHRSHLDAGEIHEQSFSNEQNEQRVVEAALAYTDFDDQVTSALDEIENILIERGVIHGEKAYNAP